MIIIFHRFQHVNTSFDAKKGDFDGRQGISRPKKFEDEEVEALFD